MKLAIEERITKGTALGPDLRVAQFDRVTVSLVDLDDEGAVLASESCMLVPGWDHSLFDRRCARLHAIAALTVGFRHVEQKA